MHKVGGPVPARPVRWLRPWLYTLFQRCCDTERKKYRESKGFCYCESVSSCLKVFPTAVQ